ncbi:MAG TPA: restriction endonuclease, partial [Bacillota bacterium]|nr:restriction endonuclease [Bacillota bacterium]
MLEGLIFILLFLSVLATIVSLVWLTVGHVLRKDTKKALLVLQIAVIAGISSFLAIASVIFLFLVPAFIVYRILAGLSKRKQREKDEAIDGVMGQLFQEEEMKTKLYDFILQHTRRFDLHEISATEYDHSLGLLLQYIFLRAEPTIKASIDEKIYSYWRKKPLEYNKNLIMAQIDKVKKEVYFREMEKIIDVKKYETIEDLVKDYLDYYGAKGLHPANIEVLSELAQEDFSEMRAAVEAEYTRIKEQQRLQLLENHLFSKDSSKKDIKYVDSLSGLEFEDFLKDLFISYGYSVEDLPYSNDYGADLIISKGAKRIVIQAKNYQGTVGNKAVQEVVSAKIYYKCDVAMVITNSSYTENAIKTAQASGVILVDRTG